jgi:hypothetical protein
MNSKGILFIFLFLLYSPAVFSLSQTDSLLNELSQTIENSEIYIREKQNRIERLQQILKENNLSQSDQYSIYNKLYHEYRSFQYDSAFTYALKLRETALQLDDPARITHANLDLSFILLSSGMFKEAFNTLDSVNIANMPDSIKLDYYAQRARAYYDLASYNQDKYFASRYIDEGGRYTDSAIALADRNSLRFYALRGGKYEGTKEYDKVKADFQVVLNRFSPTYHQYAMAAHSLGNAYQATGDTDKAIEMMARAAIADIKSSTKEAVALMNLAELLYNNGDESRAYSYIKQALKDADFYGSRLRKIQVAAILPIIEGERLATVESQRSRLYIFAVALSLLSLLVVIFAVIIFMQLKQLRQAKKIVTEANTNLQEANSKLKHMNDALQDTNEELLEANKIKEEYIGYSFNMYSEYLDKIEKLKRAIDRRLMAKKFDDISHVMESVNLKKEREALYLSFDRVFLKLFPNFVSVFNTFFKEEDRFILKDNQSLNIELRIFALIRIGIHDHEQIAHILEYSVRTIYNYKTKVKNRSILSNEEFERKVMEIKAI